MSDTQKLYSVNSGDLVRILPGCPVYDYEVAIGESAGLSFEWYEEYLEIVGQILEVSSVTRTWTSVNDQDNYDIVFIPNDYLEIVFTR